MSSERQARFVARLLAGMRSEPPFVELVRVLNEAYRAGMVEQQDLMVESALGHMKDLPAIALLRRQAS